MLNKDIHWQSSNKHNMEILKFRIVFFIMANSAKIFADNLESKA